MKEILNFDSSNICQDFEMTTKIIKFNSEIFAEALYPEFNRTLETGVFPPTIKLANVTPVHEKCNRSD